jgi:hypothetical protein
MKKIMARRDEERGQPRKQWITDVEEDLKEKKIRRLVNEDPRLTRLKEFCVGGHGPYWTVVPE